MSRWEAPGVGRLAVGDRVVLAPGEDGRGRFEPGMVGEITQDDGSSNPFRVTVDGDRISEWWRHHELERWEDPAKKDEQARLDNEVVGVLVWVRKADGACTSKAWNKKSDEWMKSAFEVIVTPPPEPEAPAAEAKDEGGKAKEREREKEELQGKWVFSASASDDAIEAVVADMGIVWSDSTPGSSYPQEQLVQKDGKFFLNYFALVSVNAQLAVWRNERNGKTIQWKRKEAAEEGKEEAKESEEKTENADGPPQVGQIVEVNAGKHIGRSGTITSIDNFIHLQFSRGTPRTARVRHTSIGNKEVRTWQGRADNQKASSRR